MPYTTGTLAAGLTDTQRCDALRDAIVAACVAAGWTSAATGQVAKGPMQALIKSGVSTAGVALLSLNCGDTATNNSPGAHRYWRLMTGTRADTSLSIAIAELQLRGSIGGPNLATGGIANASAYLNATYAPAMAFDGNTGTDWRSPTFTTGSWLSYQFPTAVEIKEVAITTGGIACVAMTNCRIDFSDDGVTWVTCMAYDQTAQAQLAQNVVSDNGFSYFGVNMCAASPIASALFALDSGTAYYIHVMTNPDEVYVVAQNSASRFMYMAFGYSPVGTMPKAGDGIWFSASMGSTMLNNGVGTGPAPQSFYPVGLDNSTAPGDGTLGFGISSNVHTPAAPFWDTQLSYAGASAGRPNSYVRSTYSGGVVWSPGAQQTSNTNTPSGRTTQYPLIRRQPNNWNEQAILLPIMPVLLESSGNYRLGCNMRHARYARLDVSEPLSVLTIGSNKWRIYPFHKLNRSVPEAGTGLWSTNGGDHSGSLGWAIRYDGP